MRMIKIALLATLALSIAGCQQPTTTSTNAPANTNAAPKAAAPTAESLLDMDKKAWQAWTTKDTKFFEGMLADNFVGFDGEGKRFTRAEMLKMISEHKCEVKSYSLSDPRMTQVTPDVVVLTYKGTQEGTCEGRKIPANVTAVSAYVKTGDAWKGAYHNEVAVVEPPKEAEKKDAAAMAPAAEEKKDVAATEKKEAPAANAADSSAKPTGDALTDALMAVEKRGWEAWMKGDANALEATTTKDLTFVDAMGKATFGQADVIKGWTDGSCKVSSVNVSDGKATMISSNVAVLTYKGTAVGTCNGQKIPALWATSIAVKEGETWRAAYIFETPIG